MKRVYFTTKSPTWWWLDYYIDDMTNNGQLSREADLEDINNALSKHGITVGIEKRQWYFEYEDEKEYFALLLKYS